REGLARRRSSQSSGRGRRMTCCGDRRKQLSTPPRVRVRPYAQPAAESERATSRMRYRGPSPMLLRGPASRFVYRLTSRDEVVEIDDADVGAFRRTGWFVPDDPDLR